MLKHATTSQVCVASRCGQWVWSMCGALDDVISSHYVFKLSNWISLPLLKCDGMYVARWTTDLHWVQYNSVFIQVCSYKCIFNSNVCCYTSVNCAEGLHFIDFHSFILVSTTTCCVM